MRFQNSLTCSKIFGNKITVPILTTYVSDDFKVIYENVHYPHFTALETNKERLSKLVKDVQKASGKVRNKIQVSQVLVSCSHHKQTLPILLPQMWLEFFCFLIGQDFETSLMRSFIYHRVVQLIRYAISQLKSSLLKHTLLQLLEGLLTNLETEVSQLSMVLNSMKWTGAVTFLYETMKSM